MEKEGGMSHVPTYCYIGIRMVYGRSNRGYCGVPGNVVSGSNSRQLSKEGAMTRKDYLDGKVSHEEYYRSIAKSAGIDMSYGAYALMERVKKALREGDKHLNTIPLAIWDRMGANPVLRANLAPVFKAHGDIMSIAGIVCVLKQAARDSANNEEGVTK